MGGSTGELLTTIALFSNPIGWIAAPFVAMNKQAEAAKEQLEAMKRDQQLKELELLKKKKEEEDIKMKSKKRARSILTSEDEVPSMEPQMGPSFAFRGKTLLGE